jgi:hypothetical protein
MTLARGIVAFVAGMALGYGAIGLLITRSSPEERSTLATKHVAAVGTRRHAPAPRPAGGAIATPTAGRDRLAEYLEGEMTLDEAERWKTAVNLIADLRVFTLDDLERCSLAEAIGGAHLRVRWSAVGDDEGLSLRSPELLTPVPEPGGACAREALRKGLRASAEELGGGLPALTLSLVLDVPVAVPVEVRQRVDQVERQIADNVRAGRPPLMESTDADSTGHLP